MSHSTMQYSDYVNGVSFRFCQPSSNPWLFNQLSRVARRLGYSLEMLNTLLPEDPDGMHERLEDLCRIPRMSTYAIGAMINAGVARMPVDQAFVNVGVWNGFTFLAGMMRNADKTCIGVDNFSEFGGPREAFQARFRHYKSPNHFFYDMDYREYFAKVHKQPIGFYIYDGEHSYENQLEGLKVAEPHFAPGCIVLVDDTNLKAPRWAVQDFLDARPNQYRVLLDRRTHGNLHPTLWNGVIVLQKTGI
ncbi:MAG TPA: class I SAM-dependent methyltransferase [Nevskiales bacterium]|nr:class I SAM-dependent methyltransferase [Nevskiales bacterium]